MLLLAGLAGIFILGATSASQARKPDYCRWAPHNAHICWYYHGGAFYACDDDADNHRVRAWIHNTEEKSWYVKVPNKTGSGRACTGMIHEPGGPSGFGFWKFRLCIDHEGCTRWRYARDGSLAH
jgi:hypothetical protein